MSITVDEAIRMLLIDLKSRCVASTVVHYSKRLRSFVTRFHGVQVTDLTSEMVKDHVSAATTWPDGTSKAPDTIRTTIVAWMQLQKWLLEEGHITEEITKKFKKPGGRKRELIPTNEETKAILSKTTADFHLIYRALRLTGARPGELCAAQITDFDRTIGEIVLKIHKTVGKTGKPRRIAVGHDALVAIINEAIGNRTEGPIFVRSCGKPWSSELLSHTFRRARDAAGLRKGLVLYLCRHEHATTLYKLTGDLKVVADALGHAQLSTTMRYTRVDSDQLKKNQKLFNEGLD